MPFSHAPPRGAHAADATPRDRVCRICYPSRGDPDIASRIRLLLRRRAGTPCTPLPVTAAAKISAPAKVAAVNSASAQPATASTLVQDRALPGADSDRHAACRGSRQLVDDRLWTGENAQNKRRLADKRAQQRELLAVGHAHDFVDAGSAP